MSFEFLNCQPIRIAHRGPMGRITFFSIAIAIIGIISLSDARTAVAQKHELIRSDLAPGIAAQYKLLGNSELGLHTQPVRVVAPVTTRLSIVTNGGFSETNNSSQTVGLRVGPLYRFKVSGVYNQKEHDLYPSVELLDRLHPPKGFENQFPVMIVITDNDLKEAIAGNLVTKVIYLEDSETALPRQSKETDQSTFDISSREDPIRVAEGLGRPMAILRIGSRVPTPEELQNVQMSAFNSETPTMLPQESAVVDSPAFEIVVPDVGLRAFELPDAYQQASRDESEVRPLKPIVRPASKMNVTTWQNLSDQDE